MTLKPGPNYRWVILLIYILSQFVLSIAGYGWGPLAPFLKKALSLSAAQIGAISSVFYFSASLSSFPSGVAVDRYGAKNGLLFWLGLTGLPLLFTGATRNNFIAFVVLVSIAGLGYGMGNPVASKGLFFGSIKKPGEPLSDFVKLL